MNEAIFRTDAVSPWRAGLLRACYAVVLFCTVLTVESSAALIPGHWEPVWVPEHTEPAWVDGYWRDYEVAGHSEPQWVAGHWDT